MIIQQDVSHHTANIAAVGIPIVSLSLNWPLILTLTTSALGAVWYLILIGKEVYSWFKRKKEQK